MKKKPLIVTTILIAISFLSFNDAIAQGMMDPVSFQITEVPEQVETGKSFKVVIEANIEGNWHLYSINNAPDAGPYPTSIEVKGDYLELAGEVTESEPIIAYDPNFDAQVGWHAKEAAFTIPVLFKEGAAKNLIQIDITYQVCNDKFCLPPKTKTVSSPVSLAGEKQLSAASDKDISSVAMQNNSDSQKKKTKVSPAAGAGIGSDGGILSFLWIAIMAGFAALLTPCVFPMIPLTVSFFSKKNESNGRQGVGQAALFGLAIVATFTILGALLALFVGVAGANRFASNPWVNLFIGGVLLVFAVSLLGAFEIRLPYRLTNWLNRKSNEGSGITGILFMSLTISAVSFSCTAPFVGGVLAATAGGEWFYPILGMIGFSAAFASPFILFALFPGWLESLPKSGSWMNIVKVLLGFIELAAAVKFFSNVDLVWGLELISRPFAIAIWIAIFLLAGLYLLGTYSLNHEKKPKQIGTGRLMLAIPFLLFSFYLIPGLLGSSLGIWDAWLPPKRATDVSVVYTIAQAGYTNENGSESEAWSENFETSMAEARETGQPIFIDFTGYTCTNCRAMEANVFPLAGVQKHFEKMELVRLFTDAAEHGIKRQKLQFEMTGTIALPTYAIVNPYNGRVIEQISGYTDKNVFIQFLTDGLQKFKQLEVRPEKSDSFLGSLNPSK